MADLDTLYQKRDRFCDDCEYMYDCGGYEECWGEKVHMPEYTCDADLDPDDEKSCPRHDTFSELLDEIEEAERELDAEAEEDDID
jgi:hypothetical protein